MSASGNEHISDIAITSRVRFARNIKGEAFPNRAGDDDAMRIRQDIFNVFKNEKENYGFSFYDVYHLGIDERNSLVEKHLISSDIGLYTGSSCVISSDETLSIMVNEEDHLRIQAIVKGFNINQAYGLAKNIEEIVGAELDYAYSEKYGYLTACPTNIGSGMRAGVMLHLPALALSASLPKAALITSRFGLAVRGIFGENSPVMGDIYQISNQNSLGQSEKEILNSLHNVSKEIIIMERDARDDLMRSNSVFVKDTVCRAYGILANAYSLSAAEAMKYLSDLKMGVDMGLCDKISSDRLDKMMTDIQPSTLNLICKNELEKTQRDIFRAEYVRNILNGADGGAEKNGNTV